MGRPHHQVCGALCHLPGWERCARIITIGAQSSTGGASLRTSQYQGGATRVAVVRRSFCSVAGMAALTNVSGHQPTSAMSPVLRWPTGTSRPFVLFFGRDEAYAASYEVNSRRLRRRAVLGLYLEGAGRRSQEFECAQHRLGVLKA